ncbi:hypothetical protein A5906_15630 [Bradyrhizobium sacchari]|uniref:Uncharacterized protein n=1 Tax=Bradyrhizobium sacchari TaxID=1399419 RepID=A0A560JAK3_9BRAD|nr:hypothetical protein [Bradyrhizobium sacchari]OPY94108.1 hypothetical protein A5906_15630 [Bradyrhizobium sacchari]TWB49378.1 hypothetical protein FBZ94_113113 [Bradyrhizobium sacchari]TWB68208.1 hypothetical protein FBZ95_112113 [Bradyrhizobium sacchari]
MFELDAFVIRGYEKVIDHYRWLRDSGKSDLERERFQRRIDQEHQMLTEYLEEKSRGALRAA